MAGYDPYTEGKRRTLINLLDYCLRELGVTDPYVAAASWVIERQEAIATLRELCREFGDNDWADDLHFSDILDKHLSLGD
jgi:hypothetical protein